MDGHKLALTSVISTSAGIAAEQINMLEPSMQDVTQTGQILSIIVSIISGVVSLVKLLRRKKND